MAMTTGESAFTAPPRPARAALLDLDPDLGDGLSPEQEAAARGALVASVAVLPEGHWGLRLAGASAALGLLVVDGLIVRETACGGNHGAELLGCGDVIRPWQEDDDSLIAARVSWFVAEEARVAVLDPALTSALGDWPPVAAELFDRALRRARWQAMQRAIAQIRRLDLRTLLYLWHLGERFGRVTPDGIAVRLPLTHERLAALVGAHRPSVTTALTSLERDGLIVRTSDHQVVLTPRARAAVQDHSERRRVAAA